MVVSTHEAVVGVVIEAIAVPTLSAHANDGNKNNKIVSFFMADVYSPNE